MDYMTPEARAKVDRIEASMDDAPSRRDQRRESVVGETTERIIAGLSRGQQVTFIEGEHCEDMIAVHSDTSASTILFGTAAPSGVDVILQKNGEEHYAFISRESWDSVCCHLVETNLHPEWSYARQMAFGDEGMTAHKPRGVIFKQVYNGKGRFACIRFKVAQMLKRPIYTALELTDGSTVWERWG